MRADEWESYSGAGWRVESAEHVVKLRLDRPPGNRLNIAALERLNDIVHALAQDEWVRAVLLWSTGEDFCQGVDLNDEELVALMTEGRTERMRFAKLGQQVIEGWISLPMPTVAALRGHAIGGGACLITASDFRVAHPSARLSFPEIDRGLHLGWGILPRVVREFGLPWARRLAMVGEKVQIGSLPDRAFYQVGEGQEDEQAERLALALASKPPMAMRTIKSIFREITKEDNLDTEDDALHFAQTIASQDFTEALAAFFEKRKGDYKGM